MSGAISGAIYRECQQPAWLTHWQGGKLGGTACSPSTHPNPLAVPLALPQSPLARGLPCALPPPPPAMPVQGQPVDPQAAHKMQPSRSCSTHFGSWPALLRFGGGSGQGTSSLPCCPPVPPRPCTVGLHRRAICPCLTILRLIARSYACCSAFFFSLHRAKIVQ